MVIRIHQDKWFKAEKIKGFNNIRRIDGIIYKFVYADPKSDHIEVRYVE